MNANFLFGAAEANDGVAQRFASGRERGGRLPSFFRRVAMRRFFHVDHNIGAMKRDDARPRPAQDQRQQMDGDMPEINVEQLRLVSDRELSAAVAASPVEICHGAFRSCLNQNRRRKCSRRFADDLHGRKWESRLLLTFLRNHDRAKPFQRRDLPVDVQHLRLEKCRAVDSLRPVAPSPRRNVNVPRFVKRRH